MEMFHPKCMSRVETLLRKYPSLYDSKGNAITYDLKSKIFDFGVYQDMQHLILNQIWFTAMPRKRVRQDVVVNHKVSIKRQKFIDELNNNWSSTIRSHDLERIKNCKESELDKIFHEVEVSCFHREEAGSNNL